jgi:CHAD domain-containing protein
MALDRDRLRKSVGKLRQFLKKQKSMTPEKIHQFRTQARRFEASVKALGSSTRDNEERLLRDLARLRKQAGRIRDMDVFTGWALTIRPEGEQDCAVQLLEHLGAERYKRAKKMLQQAGKYRQVLRQRLKRSLGHLDRLLEDTNKNPASATNRAPTDAMASALQLVSQLKTPARLSKKTLHRYRLKVKELRYVLQMSDAADQKFITKLGEVKDAIGEWHDWDELSAIAAELLKHGSKCGLLRELKTARKAKYDRALSLTNEMRDTYLPWAANASNAKAKQARRIAQPVLVSMTALAE